MRFSGFFLTGLGLVSGWWLCSVLQLRLLLGVALL
jgi:hypothetical protein